MSEPKIMPPPEKIAAFCRKWKVTELSVFGSVLRDDFGPESDVDVLVALRENHGWGLYEWLDMIDELQEMFGREVDLVSKAGLKNPFRRSEIMSTRRILYAA